MNDLFKIPARSPQALTSLDELQSRLNSMMPPQMQYG